MNSLFSFCPSCVFSGKSSKLLMVVCLLGMVSLFMTGCANQNANALPNASPTAHVPPTLAGNLTRQPSKATVSADLGKGATAVAEIVLPTLTPTEIPGDPFLLVDVSEQKLFAYKGEVLVKEFVVSTGDFLRPTLLGEFDIYNKYEKIDLIGKDNITGEAYYYRDVEYVMQFWGAFYIHSVYWHDDFGKPVSNGCVNMRVEDAKWVFEFAPLGTKLKVQR
jgi:lipoprotein-anchoring transpeptidase ErfK/SrfK